MKLAIPLIAAAGAGLFLFSRSASAASAPTTPATPAAPAEPATVRPLHPTHAITGRLPTKAERAAEIAKQLAFVIQRTGPKAPSGKLWKAARVIKQGDKTIRVNLANVYHWNAWNAAKNRPGRLATTTQPDWDDMNVYVGALADQ